MIKILAKNKMVMTLIWIYGHFRINGNFEERNSAMLEDATAFGIGSTAVGIVQFVIGASSIAVLNFAAQKQVINTWRYFEKFFTFIRNIYIYIYIYKRVCVRAHTHTHTHILCCKNKFRGTPLFFHLFCQLN